MHAKQLPIPDAAAQDARAVELVRVWAAQGKQHVSLATGQWNDPAAWGIMLVDLAKHVASAYHQTSGKDIATILARIKVGFDAEWRNSTDEPSGNLIG